MIIKSMQKKIVTLNEEFTFARNKNNCKIDDEVVYEFFSQTDEEYLNEMAQQSVYATYLYLKNLEKQSKSFNINNRII
jgi:hypothetical protein